MQKRFEKSKAEREMIKIKRILVVEDDVMLNSGLCYNLELDEYKAIPVHDAASALEKIQGESFDLIILDVNLPDGDGFDLCKKIKSIQDTPVVFLTARDLESDVMAGFELGADDYITKPFNINIFRKKVAVILKRSEKSADKNLYLCGDLVIDFDKLAASIKDEPVIFTPTEYKILKIFTSNPNILLSRQVFLEKLYDVDANFVDEHTLTVNVNRLRNKIETKDRKYIKTVYGMGYLWDGDEG
jgi:DNA-binding response OmpR family regulator